MKIQKVTFLNNEGQQLSYRVHSKHGKKCYKKFGRVLML